MSDKFCRHWTNLIEYFKVTPSYTEFLNDGTTIPHTFTPLGVQQFSHTLGVAQLHITDETGSVVYGSTVFANTGSFTCPLPGVPITLVRANGQKMTTSSGADGTFSFSITLGESVTVFIPPYQGFTWSSTLSVALGAPISNVGITAAPTSLTRRLLRK